MNHLKKKCYKAIVLITSAGKGQGIVEKLFENGVTQVDLHHARGSLPGSPSKKNGDPIESEQDLVTCLVEEFKADEVFGLVYELAEMESTAGSFLYMRELNFCTPLELPA